MMKKICITILLLAALLCCVVPVCAAGASASLAGPGTVRAGDTITLTFQLNGSNILGASGTLSFDTNQLTLVKTAQTIAAPWMVEFNGNNFVAYDNNQTNPIQGNKGLFTATFQVKSVAPGTAITVSCQNVVASDGTADANIGTVSYSVTVALPLSSDNELSSLTVGNAAISPAFAAGTTSYSAEVPFEVSQLQISATARDAKASVSVHSPTLTPNGVTQVSVTVTAENGAKRTYTISVKRAQDPNYVPSSNSQLSSITVNGFLLSPAFTAENRSYVIWLPYETESVTVSGTAADSKASVAVEGGGTLFAGQDNEIKVICTAEDGTKTVYTVIAKRAAAHDGSVETLPTQPPQTQPPTTLPPETQPPQTQPSTQPTEPPVDAEPQPGGIAWWWLPVVGIVALIAGLISGFHVHGMLRRQRRRR